ncbi:MAG TPA: hypothetical protein VFQ61_29515, partial [Polyangiaceae bacterium]|nr:hypothetical protein [Polyangiaceae bacterium]
MTQDRSRPGHSPPAAPAELPCFGACTEHPKLDVGIVGLRIATAGVSGTREQPRWILHGVLRVARELAGPNPEELFARIVIVLRGASSERIQARHAF